MSLRKLKVLTLNRNSIWREGGPLQAASKDPTKTVFPRIAVDGLALAAEQGANPLTVAKAYQQFQNDGLVEVQRGVGMYVVKGAAEALRRRERDRFLKLEWPEIRARMDRLGLKAADLVESI